jgi:hypothetical protein
MEAIPGFSKFAKDGAHRVGWYFALAANLRSEGQGQMCEDLGLAARLSSISLSIY